VLAVRPLNSERAYRRRLQAIRDGSHFRFSVFGRLERKTCFDISASSHDVTGGSWCAQDTQSTEGKTFRTHKVLDVKNPWPGRIGLQIYALVFARCASLPDSSCPSYIV